MAAKKNKPAISEQEKALRSRLYGQAERIVVKAHEDEFHTTLGRLYAEHGLTYRRRLTPQEKALEDVRKQMAEHPEIRDQILSDLGLAPSEVSAA